DGIRDATVTGVQTCALPSSLVDPDREVVAAGTVVGVIHVSVARPGRLLSAVAGVELDLRRIGDGVVQPACPHRQRGWAARRNDELGRASGRGSGCGVVGAVV